VKKNNMMKIASAIVVVTSMMMATGAQAHERVSPFTDNLTVHLSGFNSGMAVSYSSDNDVNINGPANIGSASSFPVTISSENIADNGNPSMTVKTPQGDTCQLKFVDGPWTYLNFQTQSPPSCSHIQVSQITPGSSNYTYDVTLTYQN
jgi:hypothetical protein